MKNKEWYSNQNQNVKHDYIPEQRGYELWAFINSLIFFMWFSLIDESVGEFSARNIIEDLMKIYLPDFHIVEKRKASTEAIIVRFLDAV